MADAQPSLTNFDFSHGVWRRMSRRRYVVLAFLIVVTAVVPGVNQRPVAVGILAATLVLAILTDRFMPLRHRYIAWWVQVTAMSVIGAELIPEAWFAALVIVVVVGAWLRLGSEPIRVWVILGPSFLALGVIGLQHDPEAWEPTLAIAVALTMLTGQLTRGMRVQLRENEDVLARSLATSASFLQISDLSSSQIVAVTGPVQDITGWTPAEWRSIDHAELIHPDDFGSFWITKDEVATGEVIERQARYRRPDDSWVWLRDVSQVLESPSGHVYIRGITMDVTAIEEANLAIRREAEIDGLTNLPNRRKYVSVLEDRLARGNRLAVMIMDLDRFKAINDTLGHASGDEFLVLLAERLRKNAPRDCVVARLGGDEFAVISDAVDAKEARRRAHAFAAVASEVVNLGGMSISTTVSIGVAISPEHGSDVSTLLRHADTAMYEAKNHARSVQIYTEEIEQTPLEEVTLRSSLRKALDEDEFMLAFQPKIDLTTGAVVGFEGLARWNHPTLGVLGPSRFIHLVTWSEEGREFADRIIELGATFAASCREQGATLPVAVNIAARSLFDDTLPDRTARTLSRLGVPPELMVIEITESDIMDEAGRSSRVIERLAQLGVRISIDDFGTGYSSLARLVDLPISEIKIDRRFVSGSQTNRSDEVIMRSIIDLAETLGLNVVAEGVEAFDDIARLVSFGCSEAQGFLFAQPLDPDEARSVLTSVYAVGHDQAHVQK